MNEGWTADIGFWNWKNIHSDLWYPKVQKHASHKRAIYYASIKQKEVSVDDIQCGQLVAH